MPDEKISQLPAVAAVIATDLTVVVAGGVTSKITEQQLINSLAGFITANVNINGAIHLNNDGSASFAIGGLLISDSGSMVINGGTITFSTDGTATFSSGSASFDSAGNALASAYQVGGIQVVGAQEPAIANATNAIDVITQFNTLLAALRASTGHGLIAG